MRKMLIFLLLVSSLLLLPNIAFATENPTVNRLAGSDRYETAYQIAKAGWTQSDYAILAYGENYPDALAAVPLAKKLNAPILLTNNDSLNAKTLAALQELKVKTVYLIGGNGVITTDEENALTHAGYIVNRLAGQDRYETAIKIAEQLGNISEVAVTTGDDYADALSIGPIAAEKQMPIILVPKDDLTSSIQNYISSKTITKTYIVGWQNIISDNVANKFPNPERITGSDKYVRNIAVLNRFTDVYQHDKICLATGENFADALAGAVYAAKNNGAIALVKNFLPASTSDFLKGNFSSSSNITVFGGEGAVSSSMLQTISNSSINTADKLDFGSINGQTYTNNYFGLKITIPSQFAIGDSVALTKAAKENKNITDSSDASNYNDVVLLTLSKKANDAAEVFIAQAEKVNSNFSTSDEYLIYGKNQLMDSPLKLVFPKDIYTEKIDGIDYRVLDYNLKINSSSTMNGKVYASLQKGYILTFSKIYTNNIDTSDLDQLFSAIKINQ